jgi:alkylation response protein AidB-like acyl-CoA dehydrogenase
MMSPTNPTRARDSLRAWESSKPSNFFTSDVNLQRVLQRHMGGPTYQSVLPTLTDFGASCATIIDAAAKQEDLIGNHPRLERYTGIGDRVENIEFHPNHDMTGEIVWRSRILAVQREMGNNTLHLALFYLLSHNGEAGHCCSVACTSGLIRALQYAADPAVRDKFLPSLLDPNYATMQHGAQFLTEVQGGSDVGANAVRAVDAGDGTWRISGEKWFCSNVNADQFLVMARPDGAKAGTGGLGAFLVPRRLDDGSTNGFYIRRLKDKLGTRTLASAELDFTDAVAYPIGSVDAGFKITVELVLNTSRLLNAVSCAGIMRRAYLEAASYACSREAFGSPIANYPLVQEAAADILSENYAATASGFALANLLDRIDTSSESASEDDQAVYRLLVNVNKYITSIRATESIHRAIEVLGGNGAIESFSILPRLYRDMIVLESWEGTHNVLCLQVIRDIARYQLHEPFARYIDALLSSVTHPVLTDITSIVREAQARTNVLVNLIMSGDSTYQQAHARRLVDHIAHVAQGALLLAEAEWELALGFQTNKPDVAAYLINRRVAPSYDPLNDNLYLSRLERIMGAI